MEPNHENLGAKIDSLSGQIHRISYHLFNDEDAGVDGVIAKVNKNDRRLEKLETDAKIRKASNAVWGSIGGGLILLARELFAFLKHA